MIDKYKSGFSPVLDVVFEDLSNPMKNSSTAPGKLTLSTKTKKRAGLRGIFGGGQKVRNTINEWFVTASCEKNQLNYCI